MIPDKVLRVGEAAKLTIEQSRIVVQASRDYLDAMLRDREPWTAEEDALLGTDTDRAIAGKIRRSSVSVSNRRKKLGIARKFSA